MAESATITDLKKTLAGDNVVLGTDKTLKSLKTGKLSTVFVTSNCPDDVKNDIAHYSSLTSTEVVNLDLPNDELGVICKKPFSISVAALLKEE